MTSPDRYADTPPDQAMLTDVSRNDIFASFKEYEQFEVLDAELSLQLATKNGLDLSRAKRILDFGAGSGGPTLALVELAQANGGSVEAIEQDQHQARKIYSRGILPASRVHMEDGLSFLGAPEQSGQYDLITAFLLGPDYFGGRLSRALLAASANALTSNGHLLVTTDFSTIGVFRRACQEMSTKYTYIAGIRNGDRPLPAIVLVSNEHELPA